VVLGIALPFFIIPLVMFTATAQDGCTRGADLGHIAGPVTAALLIALNFKLLADQLFG
jgi:Mn2+/Fe2+ NRAMP family transporter